MCEPCYTPLDAHMQLCVLCRHSGMQACSRISFLLVGMRCAFVARDAGFGPRLASSVCLSAGCNACTQRLHSCSVAYQCYSVLLSACKPRLHHNHLCRTLQRDSMDNRMVGGTQLHVGLRVIVSTWSTPECCIALLSWRGCSALHIIYAHGMIHHFSYGCFPS
jgi:hypothetical protein